MSLSDDLLQFYAPDGPERVGFVLMNDEIVEVKNVHPNPEHAFDVDANDIIWYEDRVKATWHTHPGSSSNLSGDDYVAFTNWPLVCHYIIGADGLRQYVVIEGRVEDHSARAS